MKFHHARIAGVSALAASLLSACVMSATGSVTPGQIGGSASPAASGSPAAASTASPQATAKPSASPTAGQASASPSASPTAATGGKTGDAEPNDDFAQASVGAWDTPISGTAGSGDETGDFYKLEVPAGTQDGWLVVTLSETSENYSPSIEYYKANKATLTSTTYAEGGTADPTEGKVRVKAGNSYYVKLAPHAGDEAIAYTVTFKFVPVADANERNDTFETATALTLGTATQFATFWADDADDDKDYFKVTLPEGKTKFRVEIANKTTSNEAGSYRVGFFEMSKASAASTLFGSSQADLTGAEALSDDLAPGDYYLLVEGDNTAALSDLTVTAE